MCLIKNHIFEVNTLNKVPFWYDGPHMEMICCFGKSQTCSIYSSSVWQNKAHHVLPNSKCYPPCTWSTGGSWSTLFIRSILYLYTQPCHAVRMQSSKWGGPHASQPAQETVALVPSRIADSRCQRDASVKKALCSRRTARTASRKRTADAWMMMELIDR